MRMPSRPTRVRATWLALSLSLSASVATSLGLSLCVAKDGHASLELSHADTPCTLEVERHHPDEAAFDAHELSHHPCEDRPLVQCASWMASSQKRLDAPATGVVHLLPRAAPAVFGGESVVGESGAISLDRTGRQRRSIVLLV